MTSAQRASDGVSRVLQRLTRAAFVLSLVLGSAHAALAGQPRDARISAKVELTLRTTESIAADALVVDTADGRVTLRGNVATDVERSRAAIATRRVAGVRDVRNLLRVDGERAVRLERRSAIAARSARSRAGVP